MLKHRLAPSLRYRLSHHFIVVIFPNLHHTDQTAGHLLLDIIWRTTYVRLRGSEFQQCVSSPQCRHFRDRQGKQWSAQ